MSIIHKRSSVAGKVPTTAQLGLGELAINTTDGKLYLKKSVNGVESVVDVAQSVDGKEDIGTMVITKQNLAAPKYLPANGSVYMRSAYPILASQTGYLNADLAPVVGPTVATTDSGGTYRNASGVFFLNGKFYMTTGGEVYSGATIFKLFSSTDGLSWTQISANAQGKLMAYGAGRFVMAGHAVPYPSGYATSNAWHSLDGVTWTAISANSIFGSNTTGDDSILDLIYANGMFVMVGKSITYPTTQVATSVDGIAWTRRTGPALQKVVWTGQNFVGISGVQASDGNKVYTSPDGATWTQRLPSGAAAPVSVCSNGNGTVVFVDYGERVWRSVDHGVTWTHESTLAFDVSYPSIGEIVYCDDQLPVYLLMVSSADNLISIMMSTDGGKTFFTKLNNQITIPSYAGYGAFGNGTAVVAGTAGETYRLARPYDLNTQFSTPLPLQNTIAPEDSKMYIRAT